LLESHSLMDFDFLVVGAGVAGLRAAIELSPAGTVLVIAKDTLRESSSEYAQGGIAVALSDDDDIELHEADTLYAGDGLCDRAAVRTLVEEGPAAIEQLIEWGAEFDRDGKHLSFTREAAHSRNRILHSHGDSTGREIARTLYQKAASIRNITFQTYAATTDLLMDSGQVIGAVVYDERNFLQIPVYARAVLLATGGLGRVYSDTTNPDVATGDGVAMAWRAGAEIENIEFVQFHPTALNVPGAPRFLLSEALRGEGAVLLNGSGERFMSRYHEMAELAPRDVVARAIVAELKRTGGPTVFLDLTSREPEFIRERFPRVYKTCLHYGVDISTSPAPVRPAAHYAMGGIRTDLDGRTSLKQLFAAGEAACTGVHGANRLASNSLLEGLVFGERAGRAMRDQKEILQHQRAEIQPPLFPDVAEDEIRKLAWDHMGISRNGTDLKGAIDRLKSVKFLENPGARLPDYDLRSIHTVAGLIARSALKREESRGAHFRTDFPEKRAIFEKPTILSSQPSHAGR
jgi:L-aspartate oxidase